MSEYVAVSRLTCLNHVATMLDLSLVRWGKNFIFLGENPMDPTKILTRNEILQVIDDLHRASEPCHLPPVMRLWAAAFGDRRPKCRRCRDRWRKAQGRGPKGQYQGAEG